MMMMLGEYLPKEVKGMTVNVAAMTTKDNIRSGESPRSLRAICIMTLHTISKGAIRDIVPLRDTSSCLISPIV